MLLHRTHLSAQEIASLELEGLPATRAGVRQRADRDGWAFVARPGRGGGRAYAVADLPASARRDLDDRRAALPAPVRPVGRPKGATFFAAHPDIADAIESYIASRALSATAIHGLLAPRFPDLPSVRTIKRFINSLEATKPAVLASMRDPDAYKSRYRMAIGRADAALTHAHQLWEIDTTQADVMCVEGRRSILGIIDVWSRRAFYLVVPSESAQSVRRTLVACMTAWGVKPERIKTDQGSGYINQTIRTALPLAGIVLDPCPPGSPERKPHVERLFGTFTRERAELLSGYVGHNVAEAAKLRAVARKQTGRAVIVPTMTEVELQGVIDGWLDGVYHQRRHSTTGATPFARWTNSPVPPRAAPSADVLKLVLSASVGTAIVGKQGIRWKHGRYWSPALVPFIGRTVQLRRDEDDLGALFVFDDHDRYIDTAVNAERAGLSDQDFARQARRQQAEMERVSRAEIRAKQSRYRIEDAVRDRLIADAEAAGRLVSLPVRTEAHSTPTIDSITARPAPVQPEPVVAAIADTILARPRGPAQTFEQRRDQTDRVLADHAAGRPVDPDALRAARLFARSPEYEADKILSGNFARAAATAAHTPKELRA